MHHSLTSSPPVHREHEDGFVSNPLKTAARAMRFPRAVWSLTAETPVQGKNRAEVPYLSNNVWLSFSLPASQVGHNF